MVVMLTYELSTDVSLSGPILIITNQGDRNIYYKDEFVVEIKTSVVRGCCIGAEVYNLKHFWICLFYLNLTEKNW